MKTYLEINEIEQLEKAADNLRDKILIHLLFHLGCRITEALSIKVEDIDFSQSTVTIIHLKHLIKLSCPFCGARLGSAHLFCPKCGQNVEKNIAEELEHRRQRVLPIDRNTLNLLKDYISREGPVQKDGKVVIFGINRHRAWQPWDHDHGDAVIAQGRVGVAESDIALGDPAVGRPHLVAVDDILVLDEYGGRLDAGAV
jgi:integrase/recombinase XerD